MNTPPIPTTAAAVRCPARRVRGFTAIELAVTLAIVSVIFAAAAPALADYIRIARVKAATTDLFDAFLLARSEAAKSNSRIVVCKSADGSACAATGGWEQGWIMFRDTNSNGARDPDDPIFLRGESMTGGLRVSGNGSVARYVSYAPDGMARLVGGGFQAGTITLCNAAAGDDAREIIINASGRPRVQKTRVPACF
jgi:type IV fimbrial biogenesis protein FimT